MIEKSGDSDFSDGHRYPGRDYYFYNNLKWMHVFHFNEKSRNMMMGLFVYLGLIIMARFSRILFLF